MNLEKFYGLELSSVRDSAAQSQERADILRVLQDLLLKLIVG